LSRLRRVPEAAADPIADWCRTTLGLSTRCDRPVVAFSFQEKGCNVPRPKTPVVAKAQQAETQIANRVQDRLYDQAPRIGRRSSRV